jgi:hypothetical protein
LYFISIEDPLEEVALRAEPEKAEGEKAAAEPRTRDAIASFILNIGRWFCLILCIKIWTQNSFVELKWNLWLAWNQQCPYQDPTKILLLPPLPSQPQPQRKDGRS